MYYSKIEEKKKNFTFDSIYKSENEIPLFFSLNRVKSILETILEQNTSKIETGIAFRSGSNRER